MNTKKLLLLLSWFTLLSVLAQGQSRSEPQAHLVRRYEQACGYSCAQEVAAELGRHTNANDRVAVRFCSTQPMPLALTTSAAAYGYVISILEQSYGYNAERVMLLRSEGCLGSNAAVTATEFWQVPERASLPEGIESLSAAEVSLESISKANPASLGSRIFRRAMQQFIQRLHTSPETYGIVLGYYYDRPTPQLRKRLQEVKRYLAKSGIPATRYFVQVSQWAGERSLDPPMREPTYPNFFIVKVARKRP